MFPPTDNIEINNIENYWIGSNEDKYDFGI